ncbi:MAG: MFS transporter [Bacillota bacterium]
MNNLGTGRVFPGSYDQQIRWIMWLFLVSLHLITSFHRVSFNVVADLLTAEFTLTGAGLGNLAAAYTYMYVIMQIPGGMLVDRLGPRKIALLTGLAMAAGSVCIGFAPNAALVFAGRLLIGLGGSVVLINILKFQASWFKSTEFATVSGLALLVSGTGALLGATPLAFAVDLFGWRNSFIYMGAATFLAAMICFVYVRNQPLKSGPSLESKIGNSNPEENEQDFSLKKVAAALSNRRLWSPFLINFGTYGGFIVFSGTWGVSYLVHVYGLEVARASLMMIFTYVGYMAAAPLAGLISDRIGSRKIPALFLVLCCVLFWLVLAAWPGGILPIWLLYVLSFFLGAGGSTTVLSFPMAREVSLPGYTGSVTAAVNIGVFLGMAILQPLFGFVLDFGWDGTLVEGARIYTLNAYRFGFLVCFLFAAVAFAGVLFYQEK